MTKRRIILVVVVGALLVIGAVVLISGEIIPVEEPCEPPIQSSDGFKRSDPCRIVADPDGGSVISNEIVVWLERGVSEEVLEPILEAVEGQVVGHVISTNEYKVEIQTTTFEELEAAIRIAKNLNVEGVKLITMNVTLIPL